SRHGRKDNSRRAKAIGDRFSRSTLRAALLAIAVTAAVAVPAQAATGGASTVAYGGAGLAGGDIAFSAMRSAGATWYGPGFYGHETACGQVLRPGTIGVAHRNLPCGTTVKFAYEGHYLITKVIDRGPYTKGNAWDLTNGARMALEFEGSGQVEYALALHYARH
ncbi:MAG TPA: septal ring lytic transglycosylase RlpA family protein, partial [Solirubrobacterales bacterium]